MQRGSEQHRLKDPGCEPPYERKSRERSFLGLVNSFCECALDTAGPHRGLQRCIIIQRLAINVQATQHPGSTNTLSSSLTFKAVTARRTISCSRKLKVTSCYARRS